MRRGHANNLRGMLARVLICQQGKRSGLSWTVTRRAPLDHQRTDLLRIGDGLRVSRQPKKKHRKNRVKPHAAKVQGLHNLIILR